MILCSREESGASALHRNVIWGLSYKMDAFGSEAVFEKCGNWLSCRVFSGFVKPSEVRGAEELLNYLVH